MSGLYASALSFAQRVRLFPRFYRMAKHSGRTRRQALKATLTIVYGVKIKKFWQIGKLIRLLRQRPVVCPTRSRYWVFRMWWRWQ